MVVAATLIVSALAVYGMLRLPDQAARPQASVSLTPLAAFSENGVTVEIAVEKTPAGPAWVVGTFTPLQAHFHLYSKDLPKNGLRGQGRPTLLEIASTGQVKPIGSPAASQPTFGQYSRVIEQSLPVYPDGPVILRQQIELLQSGVAAPSELSITYMACSEEFCLPPVIGRKVAVVIPAAD